MISWRSRSNYSWLYVSTYSFNTDEIQRNTWNHQQVTLQRSSKELSHTLQLTHSSGDKHIWCTNVGIPTFLFVTGWCESFAISQTFRLTPSLALSLSYIKQTCIICKISGWAISYLFWWNYVRLLSFVYFYNNLN